MDLLTIRLDETGTPLYWQLYRAIRTEILEGRIRTGEKLPSKRHLSAHLHISQNTVQSAYDQLAEEGYIASVPKSGYYVREVADMLHYAAVPTAAADHGLREEACPYDFSHHGVDRAQFPFATWRRLARDAVDEYDPDLLRQGDVQGAAPLRTAVAAYLHASRGVRCSADQVIISSGTEFLLMLLIQLFPSDAVYALENPGYERYSRLFARNRAAVTPVPLDDDGMLPDALARSGADIACITPSHQFPTGTIMPVSRRVRLLNWASERPGRYILEDDYDSEFKYGGRSIPALQGLGSGERVIYLGSFSKSLTPSLRVSYMVLPEPLLRIYRRELTFYHCPVPIFEQKTLCRFLTDGYFARHVNRMRTLYRRKRECLVAALERTLPHAAVSGAAAGVHLLVRPNNGMDEAQLIETARRQGVNVYGMSRYYVGDTALAGEPTLLLGYATLTCEQIEEAVTRLGAAWNEATPAAIPSV